MRKLLLALGLFLGLASPALAQNVQCSDRPSSDSSNACANTRFVQGAVASSSLWQVPQYSIPIGLGGTNVGFGSAAPGALGTIFASNGAAANPSFQTFSTVADAQLCSTQGAVATRQAASWVCLGPGAANTILTAAGAGANLSYTSVNTVFDTGFCSVQGSIIQRTAGGWVCLAPGTSGQVLTSGGPGADNAWAGFTVSSNLNMNNFRITNLSNGTCASPGLQAQDADSGFGFGAGEVSVSLNGACFMTFLDTLTDGKYFGMTANLSALFPPFRVDETGGGIVRAFKMIISQPGDTPEYGYYAVAGDVSAPVPWAANNLGNQYSISYTTALAPKDSNPLDYTLANGYRLINPCLITVASAWTCTKYQPSASAYVDGMTFQLKFTVLSGANPTLNWNGWGVRDVYLSNCTTRPPASNWNTPVEITVVYVAATTRFCTTASSDSSAGRTDRAAFSNPNWGRSTNTATRFSEAPTERGRGASYLIETSRPGESVLRSRLGVSSIGATILFGRSIYEDGTTENGLDRVDYYPGPLSGTGTDCYRNGDYYAGLCGPVKPIEQGWAQLSIPASDSSTTWPAIGIRHSTATNAGVDLGLSGTELRFFGKVSTGSNAIASLAEANGVCRVTTGAPHGRSYYTQVTTSGYAPTGDDTPNGTFIAWPVSTTEFNLIGSKCANSYGAGGVYAVTTSTTWGSLDYSSGEWKFGGTGTNQSLLVSNQAAQVNHVRVTGAATGAAPAVQAAGTDAAANLRLESKGATSAVELKPGAVMGMRIEGVASAVNYLEGHSSATGDPVLLHSHGSDPNIPLRLSGQGTAGAEVEGTSTNNNAPTGYVGEIVESTVTAGSAVSLTTSVDNTITSISIGAGDWNCWGNIGFTAAGTTTLTRLRGAVNTAATVGSAPGSGAFFWQDNVPNGSSNVYPVGMRRVLVAGTSTVYLVAEPIFGVSTLSGYGYVGCRRQR